MAASAELLNRLTRGQALGIHLLISAIVAAGVLILMLALWYPPPFFEVQGGGQLAFIVIGVNFVLGPVVAFFVFKPGKRGLKFDVVVLALVQVAALAYGFHVVAGARPAFLVLVTDQFEVVAAGDLEPEQLALARRPEFRRLALDGPVRVYSDAPREGDARKNILLSVLAGGPDVQLRPEYFVPFSERLDRALGFSHSPEHARSHWPAAASAIDRYLADSGRAPSEVRYLAGRAPRGWFVCVIDAVSGDVLAMAAVSESRD